MHVVRVGRCIREIAGEIAIAFAADELEQFLIAGTPVETVGLFRCLCGTSLASGLAASGIVDDSPRAQPVVALVRVEHAIPVDEHADALLERVSMKAAVACGRLVPDLATRAFGRAESFLTGVETGIVANRHGACAGNRRGLVGLRDNDRPGGIAVICSSRYRNSTADRQRGGDDGETFHRSPLFSDAGKAPGTWLPDRGARAATFPTCYRRIYIFCRIKKKANQCGASRTASPNDDKTILAMPIASQRRRLTSIRQT